MATARAALLAAQPEPSAAVELFEPIVEQLKYDPGARLLVELRSGAEPVAMEVRHYYWHLQHLGRPGWWSSSLTDVLMVTLTRFAHYSEDVPEQCEICAEFPDDMPFQCAPGGREHFREWLRQRSG